MTRKAYVKMKARERYWRNPERACAKSRAWRLANPEYNRERKRVWVRQNPEKVRAQFYRKIAKNPEKYKGIAARISRRFHLKTAYDLTQHEYEEMLKAQDGKCAICQTPVAHPDVDHDHKTDKVRGLLCMTCNRGLGQFKENRQLLIAAAEYLKRHQ